MRANGVAYIAISFGSSRTALSVHWILCIFVEGGCISARALLDTDALFSVASSAVNSITHLDFVACGKSKF